MKDLLCIFGGLIGILIGGYGMYRYITQSPKDVSSFWLIFAIAFIVIAVVCGVFYMLGRVNKQEEIHITK